MLLDKRSYSLIKALVQNPNSRITDLEKDFHLTRRQINYSIHKVNDWLESNQLPKIERSKNGSFSLDQTIIQYFSNLNSGEDSSNCEEYVPTEKERLILLILYLLSKKEEISLAHIIDVLEVSKNTAVRDIKAANDWLKSRDLEISYSRMDGYDIEGSEIVIRKALTPILEKILHMYKGETYLKKIGELELETVLPLIEKVEGMLGIQYTDQSLGILPWLLILNKRRIEQGNLLEDSWENTDIDFQDTKEYEVIYKNIDQLGIQSNNEKDWLVLQFLTANFQEASTEIVQEEELIMAIKEMIWLFEEKTYISISNKQRLLKRLAQHLRPAYYRVKYQLSLKNNWYVNYIEREENYAVLFEIIKEIIHPIEKLTRGSFDENEIALLTFFFGAELLNQGITLENKTRAVVVCTNGISISRILNYSLKELFPDFVFLNVLSTREFKEYSRNFDIVFSTVPLQTDKKVFLINPLMNEEEKGTLQRRVYDYLGITPQEISITKLLSVIRKHAKINDEDQLASNLRTVLTGNTKGNNPYESDVTLPNLSNYLTEDRIQFIEEVEDWKEAIRLACVPLLEAQKITESYIEALIDENDTEHTYSFLGKTMAIPHADKEKGVLNDGFSMLVLKNPVKFRNQHEVQVIVPLAIEEKTKHLKAILQLQEIASDDEVIEKILSQEDAKQVMHLLQEKIHSEVQV